MKQSIKLMRSEIEKLAKVIDQFPDVTSFEIETDNSNGIGVSVCVKMSLLSSNDTKIDITDLGAW